MAIIKKNYLANHSGILFSVLIHLILIPFQQCYGGASGKVVDFGDKLPDYVKEHPNKGWLIKFYTPWCYNCQQIELTYIEVGEKIYHAHDHLIVGQVNCDKYDAICRQYNVAGVPTIMYLKGDQQSKYIGPRDVGSIISFAERMNGPNVNPINRCDEIHPEIMRRGLIVLHSGDNNKSSELYVTFHSLASQLKRDYWFYSLNNKTCGIGDRSHGQGVFILKRNLRRWIKFEPVGGENLEQSMRDFILRKSFPVFGPLSNQMMNSTRLLAVAVLDEYGPSKKLDPLSKKFYKIFEQVAIEEAQINDEILFAWSTDLHAMRKITLSHVTTPNIILLKADLSNHLLIESNNEPDDDDPNRQLPEMLTKRAVSRFIEAAKEGQLEFTSGDTYFYRIARYIYSYIILFKDRYKANPVLTSLMLISLITTIVVLLYMTRNYLGDDEEEDSIEVRSQTNHRKQD